MVGVDVVVHHGCQETGRGADRQRTLGQVWTALLLQVTALNNLSLSKFLAIIYHYIIVSIVSSLFHLWRFSNDWTMIPFLQNFQSV